MCDLLIVSFSGDYRDPKTLHRFMIRSIDRGDIDGWGLGFFLLNRKAVVIKDVEIDVSGRRASSLFAITSKIIESEIIVAHFRLATRKHIYGREYAHPFKSHFLGEDWIFAHNGFSDSILNYETIGPPIHTHPEFDSPRVFEYLRDRIVEFISKDPTHGLLQAVEYAVKRLYEEYPGVYNFILANSNIAFVNLDGTHPHNNRLYITFRHRFSATDRAIVVTTVPNLTQEKWIEIKPKDGHRGKLLMLSEGELLSSLDI